MTSKNESRQIDMFTGKLVDTRTSKQRKAERESAKPKQIEMFATSEVAQFGVKANPAAQLSANVKLQLTNEETRTQEEIERKNQLDAETKTERLF